MSTHKDEKNGTWYVMVRYHDWKGEKKQKCKRGFATKREAQAWERTFQLKEAGDLDMTFEAFLELYERDMRPRLKENTWLSKEHMIRTKLLPYFGKRMIGEIDTKDIIAWQNELLAYRDEKKQPYAPTYLKAIHNQLVAILNHAVKHYGLKSNPASKVGYIGSKESEEMQFWTKEEYQKFAMAIMDKPIYVKLPDSFYISTPVGKYNPDWAIAFYEGTVKHIYFVAETKGTMQTLTLQSHISPLEDAKIHCAREHFKAISGDNVVYDVVDSYTSLLEKVMK